jgi:hypothetical protein
VEAGELCAGVPRHDSQLTHWSEIRSFANVIGRPADKMRSFRVCLYPKPRAAQRDP